MRSAIEQFEMISVLGVDGVFVTNSLVAMLCVGMVCAVVLWGARLELDVLRFSNWGGLMIMFNKGLVDMTSGAIGKAGVNMVSFVGGLQLMVLVCNLLGLVPYSYCLTAQLGITLAIAVMVWVGKLVLGVLRHGVNLLGMLVPAGAPIGLVWFIVIVEAVGFCIPVVSLSVRLIANLMSGHVLLKVLMGFVYALSVNALGFAIHVLPLGVVILLVCMEAAVGLVQAYVLSLLVSIYVGDMEKGGH